MSYQYFTYWTVFLFVFGVLLTGCNKTNGKPEQQSPSAVGLDESDAKSEDVHITADDVQRPSDYREAVARIRTYRDLIRDEIAANRPKKAHRPLDELAFVLEWLPELARDSGIPKDKWESINVTAQQIGDRFNTLHEQIDAGQKPDFEAVADEIQQGIETLAGIAKAEADGLDLGESPKGGK